MLVPNKQSLLQAMLNYLYPGLKTNTAQVITSTAVISQMFACLFKKKSHTVTVSVIISFFFATFSISLELNMTLLGSVKK